jgi:GDP/UDP-N,N'-diacetylbacillosamine 2-epimerase (hydrolysing)
VDGVVGNSSSGLIEVPSFKKGTINVGDRQRGRLRAASVIDCEPECASIRVALNELFSAEFQSRIPVVENPYGKGGASDAIVEELERRPLDKLLKKHFYDYPQS